MGRQQLLTLLLIASSFGCTPSRTSTGVDQCADINTANQESDSSESKLTPGSIEWGPEAHSGLQLGAWIDPTRPVLWCLIRNQGDQSIQYSDYLLDYWESVTVRARSGSSGEWRDIPRREKQRLVLSAGAASRNVHLIEPQGIMHPKTVAILEVSYVPIHTLSVHLTDFDWPEDWTGTVDVVVEQRLGRDASINTWEGVLESPVIEISVSRLRAEVEK